MLREGAGSLVQRAFKLAGKASTKHILNQFCEEPAAETLAPDLCRNSMDNPSC